MTRRARATCAVFFVAGFCTAAWAPLVPFAKARLSLDAATLGLLLIAPGVGSIATMAAAGALAARLGCRAVIVTASLLLALALPVLAASATLPVMAAALLVFGAAVGAVDVAANVHGIGVEKDRGAPLMSSFHGFYSLGGIAGAALAGALIAIGATPLSATLAVVALSAAVTALAAPHLSAVTTGGAGAPFAWPRGVVWLLGALGFILFLAEGAVLDWGGLLLTATRGLARSSAGFGYAVFAAAMTAGRLGGNRLVARLGGSATVGAGGLLAAAGFALAALALGWPASLAGYGMVGLGCANIVPVLFSAAGRQRAMPAPTAVAAITTLSYAGILAGPAAIGLIAQASDLASAFLILALLLLVVAAAGRALPRGRPATAP